MDSGAQISTIELFKEEMKFSAGHFTIFSAEERERLHGHNFTAYVAFTGAVDDNGMLANYGAFKRILFETCRGWNEYFLLPGRSPHLTIREHKDHVFADFGDETIPFLRKDVLVLPVKNVTIEELARLLTETLVADRRLTGDGRVHEITVKVSSGPGQFGSYRWRRDQDT